MHTVLVYDAAISNLGDIFQTIALTQHLPQTAGIFREHLPAFVPDSDFLIVNGLVNTLPPINEQVIFAGIHLFPGTGILSNRTTKKQLLTLKQSPHPIGARDPATHAKLQQQGIQSEMIGCSTLTFDRYTGPRSGTYSVDYAGPGVRLTHKLPAGMGVHEQWSRALEYLNYYRTAERVYTTRLHVALTCLAFGTPVCFVPPARRFEPSRFSLLRHMGVEYGKLCTLNTSKIKKEYLAFLQKHIHLIRNEHPLMPVIIEKPRKHPLALKIAYHLRNI